MINLLFHKINDFLHYISFTFILIFEGKNCKYKHNYPYDLIRFLGVNIDNFIKKDLKSHISSMSNIQSRECFLKN